MTDPISLGRARLEREDDNTKVDPIELLRYAADQLEKDRQAGSLVRRVLVIAEVQDAETGVIDIDRWRAGVTRYEEAGLLALAQRLFFDKWLREAP